MSTHMGPINYIVVGEQNTIGALTGVYVHAREVAAWLRDNEQDELADDLEALADDAEPK